MTSTSGDLEAAFGDRAQRHRPAPGGVLIGAAGAPVGSLGCLVRDNTDDSLHILSAASLVTYGGSLPVGTQIYQPPDAANDPVNLVGTVTRSTILARSPLLYPTLSAQTPSIDAAIVRPTSDDLVTDATADRLVPPAHRLHPMVALIVGLTRPAGTEARYVAIPIGSVLAALNVRPLRADAVSTVSVGRSITFVACSGTKQGTVIDVGATVDVPCAHPDGPSVVRIEDAIVIDAGYAELVDVGSVVFVWRGNEVRSRCSGCAIALELEQAYELPFVANVDLADRIRDDYLLKTVTGQMLVQLFYKNEETFRARVMGAAPTQSDLTCTDLVTRSTE